MNLTRRGFLTSCLALAAAPAIVRADSLMRIAPEPVSRIYLFGDGDFIWNIEPMSAAELDALYEAPKMARNLRAIRREMEACRVQDIRYFEQCAWTN